mmetsp:Transcript_31062/g.87497  ORF Transcript_31062/g.87497 Transcript_31062/m.87497 type:complete len:200 (-) Transcript_31062:38-637(-)
MMNVTASVIRKDAMATTKDTTPLRVGPSNGTMSSVVVNGPNTSMRPMKSMSQPISRRIHFCSPALVLTLLQQSGASNLPAKAWYTSGGPRAMKQNVTRLHMQIQQMHMQPRGPQSHFSPAKSSLAVLYASTLRRLPSSLSPARQQRRPRETVRYGRNVSRCVPWSPPSCKARTVTGPSRMYSNVARMSPISGSARFFGK